MLFFGVFLRESARIAAKSRTNLITNSGKSYQTAGPIGTTFGTHVQIGTKFGARRRIRLGMDIG